MYSYEDFIEGYRPDGDGFQLEAGIFKRMAIAAQAQPNKRFVLIIDEINRGNIPKIFGELITLIEASKRGTTASLLPLSKEPFTVPPNLLVVGTMNTADRSILLLDTALRRRFAFKELLPEPHLLRSGSIADISLSTWLRALNRRIVEQLGRDGRNLQVGHAYLMPSGKPAATLARIGEIVRDELWPLLQEYCYEDPNKLANILAADKGGIYDREAANLKFDLFEPGREEELVPALMAVVTPEDKKHDALLDEDVLDDEDAEEHAESRGSFGVTRQATIRIREWSNIAPASAGDATLLRGLRLTNADRALLAELEGRSSLRFTELRDGLAISVGPHIGTVSLTRLRIVIMPKIRIDNLMRLVAYAFELSDLTVTETRTPYASSDEGLIDLLGLSLLRAVERVARGGLLLEYLSKTEDLATPRGRLDMQHLATHARRAKLRCNYDDLTVDHGINQVLATGLRLASRVMQSADLRLDLARTADRFFGDLTQTTLNSDRLRGVLESLDRRSSHYRTALTLIALIHQGSRLGEHQHPGEMPLSSFTLNMNMVFERFLGRYLRETAPADTRISAQDTRSDVFHYLENAGRWKQPTIRPDFVFRCRRKVVAVADAKYKNRHEHPPSSADLYQLTAYGLSYNMPEPREVLLLHPLAVGEADRATSLLFAPAAATQQVRIRLVGVPIDGILDGSVARWWPLGRPAWRSDCASTPAQLSSTSVGHQQRGRR